MIKLLGTIYRITYTTVPLFFTKNQLSSFISIHHILLIELKKIGNYIQS